MKASRLPLALTAVAATALLLAACTAPVATPDPTTEPVNDEAGISEVPELRAGAPLPEPEDEEPPAVGSTSDIPEGYSQVVDDTSVLAVVLPDEWADVDGRPFATSDGREWASLIASADAEAYPTDWNTAGLEFSGTAMGEELPEDVATAFLADIASPFEAACEPGVSSEPYDDGLYVGWYSNFGNCDGGETYGIAVVAQDPNFDHFVFLRGKFVSEQDKTVTFDQIFTTFQSVLGSDKSQPLGNRDSVGRGL